MHAARCWCTSYIKIALDLDYFGVKFFDLDWYFVLLDDYLFYQDALKEQSNELPNVSLISYLLYSFYLDQKYVCS